MNDSLIGGVGTDLILALDQSGTIVDAHSKHSAFMVVEREQAIGRTISDLVPAHVAQRARNTMGLLTETKVSQASFTYTLPIDDVDHDFVCELVSLGDDDACKIKWLALINGVNDESKDQWLARAQTRLLFSIVAANESLLTEKSNREAVQKALTHIGLGTRVDRTYIFVAGAKVNSENIYVSQEYEWCSDLVESQIENPELQNIDISEFPELHYQMTRNRPFKAIVSELADSTLKEVLAQQSIKSVLLIPIRINGKLWGIIGFDDCNTERRWTGVEVAVLKMFSTTLSVRVSSSHV